MQLHAGGLDLMSQCFSEKGLKSPAVQDEPGWAVVFSVNKNICSSFICCTGWLQEEQH